MADQFIDEIVTELIAFSDANALSWNVVAQDSPARRENDAVPMVCVCPEGRDEIWQISMCSPAIANSYSVFLVNTQDLDNTFESSADTFIKFLVENFFVPNAALYNLGAYDIDVEADYDYDRSIFPRGYKVTAARLIIKWVDGDGTIPPLPPPPTPDCVVERKCGGTGVTGVIREVAATSNITIDLRRQNIYHFTLNQTSTLNVTNGTVGQCFIIRISQDSGGGNHVNWFSTIYWADNDVPTLSSDPFVTDVFGFMKLSANTYSGFIIGQNMPG